MNFFANKGSYYEPESNKLTQDLEKLDRKDLEAEIKRLHKENSILSKDVKKSMLEKMKTRRSIRKFSTREVHWEILHSIIEGGLNAPAAGNVQNYNIVLVKDAKIKHEIGKLAFQQYWLSDAPVLFVVVRDDTHICEMYPEAGEVYSIQNVAAVIENILLMAHFYDLGACWVEAFDNSVITSYLGIPSHKKVDAIIPIGFPLEDPKISKEPLISKVFYEKYGNRKRK